MHSDEGFSLVEVLITIVLMAIGVTALLTGMVTASRGASDNRSTADARQALLSTAEQVLRAPYEACSGAAEGAEPYASARASVEVANDDGANQGVGVADDDVTIEYWDGNAFGAPCGAYDADATNVSRMQRLTFQAGAESLVVVKRAPS